MEKEIEIIDFSDINAYIISGNIKNNPKNMQEIHQKIFRCWYETWDQFYHGEYQVEGKLNSNEFTRQDEILALFYKGECFALTFFKEVSWNDITTPLDAYFNTWTSQAITGLKEKGDTTIICSQFTVAKNFRKRNVDIPWKNILMSMLAKYFLESHADAMTGMMRVSKGMEKLATNHGALPLSTGLVDKDHQSELVDLVGFFHDEVQSVYMKNPYHQKFDEVWSRLNERLSPQLKLVG